MRRKFGPSKKNRRDRLSRALERKGGLLPPELRS
jgi:hypothetical protein